MENFLESVILLVVGMGGVFAALFLLAGMIWLFKAADERLNRRRIRKYSEAVETAQGVEEVNDEIVAVLSAAAVSALKKTIRVRRGRPFWQRHVPPDRRKGQSPDRVCGRLGGTDGRPGFAQRRSGIQSTQLPADARDGSERCRRYRNSHCRGRSAGDPRLRRSA